MVWRWNTFDHLDPYRMGYNTLNTYWHVRGFPHHADWTHGNGVTRDPRDGSGVEIGQRNLPTRPGRLAWLGCRGLRLFRAVDFGEAELLGKVSFQQPERHI